MLHSLERCDRATQMQVQCAHGTEPHPNAGAKQPHTHLRPERDWHSYANHRQMTITNSTGPDDSLGHFSRRLDHINHRLGLGHQKKMARRHRPHTGTHAIGQFLL